jgi:hypothetical protein
VLIGCCSVSTFSMDASTFNRCILCGKSPKLSCFYSPAGVVDGMRYSLTARVTIRYQHAGS